MLTFIRRFLQIGKEEKGFTLIELMVVVAILGILAAVAIPKFSSSTVTAKQNRVTADLRTIESAISMYKIDNNDTPPASIAALTGTYLKATPASPWGNESYGYEISGNEGTPYYRGTGSPSTTIYSWSPDTTWP
ncbi:MAG: type II secretion system protein [Bacillota bacterium]